MKDAGEFSVGALQRKRSGLPPPAETPAVPPTAAPPEPTPAAPGAKATGFVLPVDPLRLVLALWRGRWWVLLAVLVAAAPAALLGWWRFTTSCTATVQLIRRELPNSFRASDVGEAFKPRQLSVPTIVSIMRSPSLLAKVGAQARPPISASGLLGSLVIIPEKNTDLITISLRTPTTPTATAELINRYAEGVVELTRTLQQQEAAELDRFLRGQLDKADRELATVNQDLLTFSRDTKFYSAEKEIEAYLRELGNAEGALRAGQLELETVAFRIEGIERELARLNPGALRLAEAREQLKARLERYMEANPLVIEQQEKVAALERENAASTNAVADFQPGNNTVANSMFVDLVALKAQQAALARQTAPLEERLKTVQAKLAELPDKEMRYAGLKARQQSLEGTRLLLAGRQREAQLFTENSLGYYRLFAAADPREVAVSSKNRKLLIVAVAGAVLGGVLALLILGAREVLDQRIVSPSDMRRAAGVPVLARLGHLPDLDAASLARWRFATWSALFRELGDPARRSLMVGLTSARPGEGCSTWARLLAQAARERDLRVLLVTNEPADGAGPSGLALAEVLSAPDSVIRLLDHQSRATVLCPRDWSWTPDRRTAWAAALAAWVGLPRLAVVAELPPASALETVMLAETMPNLLWVSRSGTTTQEEVEPIVETLGTSDARLAGVLANEVPSVFDRLPDLSRFGLLLALGLAGASGVLAQAPAAQPPATNGVLSATALGPRLAAWQERLTLGPGDQVNLAVYGRKEFSRGAVPIGPDGRISYLQAQGVMAAGLTIDELRDRLTARLGEFHRNARVMVTPAAFRSKRYYLLGTVIDRGAYPLDRPITIIEAIARARGIATGLLEQNTVEIADLARAFLVRQGRRMPVDFVKLFQQGDLTQNIPLEPEDYIYFPSAAVNEVYILGSVASPGTVGVSDHSTVIGVITTRGGFTEKAYRQRVLVVRGSLTKPETFVVDVAAILRGKAIDFPLQPKDIVYVADRPWARVEELLDMAITAFTVTAVSTWTGQNIGPVITEPIIPELP